LIVCLLLIERKRKRERNSQGAFFQGRHALLAVSCRIFLAVRCN
jgi:hypothetical protein